MFDYWGAELKRFYQLETLAGAVEWRIRQQDRFIIPSVQRVLGRGTVTSLTFSLFQEGRFQLIFRLDAGTANRRRGLFGFVVAKREGETSTVAAAEHRHLAWLHLRAPQWIVRPYFGGTIFLPDRHGRKGQGREIYAYVTQWLNQYHELGVDKNHQFFINIHPHHLLSLGQTEAIKVKILSAIAKSYDPEQRVSMEMPEIASGDVVVTRPHRSGQQEIKIIACRKLLNDITPGRLIHLVATAGGMWADRRFYLIPEDPTNVLAGLTLGVGREMAVAWLREYAADVKRKRFTEQRHLSRAALRDLVGS